MPPLDLKDLFEQSVYISRLYVTRGIKLAARDENGLSDVRRIPRDPDLRRCAESAGSSPHT